MDETPPPDSNSQTAKSGPERAKSGPETAQAAAADPDSASRIVMDDADVQRALRRISHELIERTDPEEPIYLVAIPNGGVPLAQQIQRNLLEFTGMEVPLGILDTTLYRDDLLSTRSGSRPSLKGTEMPVRVDDFAAVLVDDVISTGRTIRAAMDALMDFGRPKSVRVAALVDRGHREFPIKIDFVGKNMPTHDHESVELRFLQVEDPGPLEVVVVDGGQASPDESEVAK